MPCCCSRKPHDGRHGIGAGAVGQEEDRLLLSGSAWWVGLCVGNRRSEEEVEDDEEVLVMGVGVLGSG